MDRGIRNDLRKRLLYADESGAFLIPKSASDAHRLREALNRGELVSPAPQVYTLPELWEKTAPSERERRKLEALSKLHPNWIFASFSAAILHGLAVSYPLMGTTHIACSRESHSRSSAAICRHVMRGTAYTKVNGIRVTPLARTAFDCIRSCSFAAGLAVADSTLRVSGMTPDDLVGAFCKLHRRHHNKWRAVETASLSNCRAENGGESVARAVMIQYGFKAPELQVVIPNPVEPSESFRVDFYWFLGNGHVAGELDGMEKYTNPSMTNGRSMVDVLSAERLRESRITGTGVKVMRFSYKDVMNADRFCNLLTSFGIPRGFPVPRVALPQKSGSILYATA